MPSNTPDWDNPCEAAKALRAAYMRLISGTAESQVEYMGNGTTRRVQYSIANLERLEAEMNKAEAECKALNEGIPNPRRRYAITGGSRRPYGSF